MAGSNGGLIGPYNTTTTTSAPGCWRPSVIAQRLNGNVFSFPGPADASYASVVGLYHMQTLENGGVRESSSGTYPLSQVTGVVPAGLNPLVPKWGAYSLDTQSSGFRIRAVNASPVWTFGTNDWCIDGWFYLIGNTGAQVLMDLINTSGASRLVPSIYIDASHKLNLFVNGSNRITGTTTVNATTWYYFAMAKVSGNTRAYLGTSGTAAQEGSTYVDANTYASPGDGASMGSNSAAGQILNGYIGEMRVTNGSGRGFSGATIAVPTVPFPDR